MAQASLIFTRTSIARKITMALSGLFLIVFLLMHLSINLLTLVSADAFNAASHFMGTNPVIQAAQYILAAGFLLHIGMGIYLNRQNQAARTQKYAFSKPEANSSWMSRNMVLTGITILLFLVVHMRNYFYEMKFGDLGGYSSDYELVVSLFDIWYYTVLYVVSFVLLALHLFHGFQSAFQSMGWNHPRYTPWIKKTGYAYALLVPAGFALIALYHFFV
jgi:succinate dehydrogenase / fumarate reductase cytochrome b subunit